MRKKLTKILLIILLLVSIGFGSYTLLQGDRDNYRITRVDYQNSKLPSSFDGFTIGYISDLNLQSEDDIKKLQSAVEDINDQHIDFMIFGGDIYDGDIFSQDQVITLLKSIQSQYGKFAVMGEKDQVDITTCQSILTESGFEVLHNEYRKIYYQDEWITFFGMENSGDVSSLETEEIQDSFQFMAIHQPDYFSEASAHVHLQLSGHTLGGYIKLPFLGGLQTKDLGSTYVSGQHTIKDATLIISDGFNLESDSDYRFLTYNEVNIITLKK